MAPTPFHVRFQTPPQSALSRRPAASGISASSCNSHRPATPNVEAMPAAAPLAVQVAPLVMLASSGGREEDAEFVLTSAAGGTGTFGPTAEQATGKARRHWLTRGSPQEVCRKIGSWHESLSKRPPKPLVTKNGWMIAGLDTFRVPDACAEAEEGETTLHRPGTAEFAEALQVTQAGVQSRSAASRPQRTLRRAPACRANATAYGGPAPASQRGPSAIATLVNSAAGKVGKRVKHSKHRSEERAEAGAEREALERALAAPVKAAVYHRTPAKTAGVLSKLLFRATQPGGRDKSRKEMAFQSW